MPSRSVLLHDNYPTYPLSRVYTLEALRVLPLRVRKVTSTSTRLAPASPKCAGATPCEP